MLLWLLFLRCAKIMRLLVFIRLLPQRRLIAENALDNSGQQRVFWALIHGFQKQLAGRRTRQVQQKAQMDTAGYPNRTSRSLP